MKMKHTHTGNTVEVLGDAKPYEFYDKGEAKNCRFLEGKLKGRTFIIYSKWLSPVKTIMFGNTEIVL